MQSTHLTSKLFIPILLLSFLTFGFSFDRFVVTKECRGQYLFNHTHRVSHYHRRPLHDQIPRRQISGSIHHRFRP